MGKRKKMHRKMSNRLNIKKEQSKAADTNPFEVHMNRVKHQVIGRKSKNDKGLPGVSREKALKKRKETLLQEYKKRHKSNKFVDRRLGEYKSDVTADEKMAMRFMFERKKKKNIFNLNEDEELTHYGHSLAEIEKFEDPRSDEDEDEDATVGEFMKEASFGGFMKLKKSEGGEDDDDKPKSRKDWIEELITLSKQKKHERQMDKEDTHELTEKLDNEWKDVRAVLSSLKKPELPPVKNPHPYDLLVKTLQFESKAKATDRLKTAEELAQEEKVKLEQMENERIRRMNENSEEQTQDFRHRMPHRSADDLDDNFDFEGKHDKKVRFLEYTDGKLVVSDDESDDILNKNFDAKQSTLETDANDDDNGSYKDDEDDEDIEEEDNFSDLNSDVDEDDDDDIETMDQDADDDDQLEKEFLPKEAKPSKKSNSSLSKKKEIPYVLPAPEKYEDFLQLIEDHSADEVVTIVERLLKYYHASLAEGNKQKLEILFAILLQHINDIVLQSPPQLQLIDKLVPYLFKLALVSPNNAVQCMKEVLVEKYADFDRECRLYLSGMRAPFPDLDTLIFLKLVSVLFPTSDFRHAVATPAMLFMGQILTQCRVKTCHEVARGMFVCNLFLEYVTFSKRYVPEAINFLRGILSIATGNNLNNPLPVPYPFKMLDNPFLKLEENAKEMKPPFKLKLQMMAEDFEATDEFRTTVIYIACELLLKFARLYDELPSFQEIFTPVQKRLDQLDIEKYPKEIEETISKFKAILNKERVLIPLKPKKKPPKSLRLLNPKIEENFRVDRKKHGKGQKNERQKLLYKIKRETKGAMREIRRDNQFLAKEQLDERIQRDNERKRKVKELYQSLAGQEGDYKAMAKQKKKLK